MNINEIYTRLCKVGFRWVDDYLNRETHLTSETGEKVTLVWDASDMENTERALLVLLERLENDRSTLPTVGHQEMRYEFEEEISS